VSSWQDSIDASRRTTFRALGAAEPAPVAGPISDAEAGPAFSDPPELRLPGVSILDVLNRASIAMDSPSIGAARGGWHSSGTTRSCVPVKLDDGRTWWVFNEEDRDGDLATPVLVVTAAGQKYLPLRVVSPRDMIIAAAGDGTDSVHAPCGAGRRGGLALVRSIDQRGAGRTTRQLREAAAGGGHRQHRTVSVFRPLVPVPGNPAHAEQGFSISEV
jgi:hypothetical protein